MAGSIHSGARVDSFLYGVLWGARDLGPLPASQGKPATIQAKNANDNGVARARRAGQAQNPLAGLVGGVVDRRERDVAANRQDGPAVHGLVHHCDGLVIEDGSPSPAIVPSTLEVQPVAGCRR
jgi:hypothetical protein